MKHSDWLRKLWGLKSLSLWAGWATLIKQKITKNDQISTQGISIKIRRFPVQNPLGACPGLGTQPHYEAPGDLQVEIVRKQIQ